MNYALAKDIACTLKSYFGKMSIINCLIICTAIKTTTPKVV